MDIDKNENSSKLFYKIGKIYEIFLFKSKIALNNYREALAIHERSEVSCSEEEQANTLMSIGNALDDQCKYEEALDYMKRSVEITKKVYGSEVNAKVDGTLNSMGAILFNQRKNEEALEYYKKSLEN